MKSEGTDGVQGKRRCMLSWIGELLINVAGPNGTQAQRQRLARTDSTTKQSLPPASVRWSAWLGATLRPRADRPAREDVPERGRKTV